MEKFFYKKKLVGVKIITVPSGSIPATNEKESLQLLTLKHPKGTYLKAHLHSPGKRVTNRLQECWIVRKGKVRFDLYGPDKRFFKYIFLTQGQAFILIAGGIAIHFIDDAEIFEVKNGPFKEDKVLI